VWRTIRCNLCLLGKLCRCFVLHSACVMRVSQSSILRTFWRVYSLYIIGPCENRGDDTLHHSLHKFMTFLLGHSFINRLYAILSRLLSSLERSHSTRNSTEDIYTYTHKWREANNNHPLIIIITHVHIIIIIRASQPEISLYISDLSHV